MKKISKFLLIIFLFLGSKAFCFNLSGTYYFDNSQTQWSNVYMFVGHGSYLVSYPMNAGSNDVYSYNFASAWNGATAVFFANGDGGLSGGSGSYNVTSTTYPTNNITSRTTANYNTPLLYCIPYGNSGTNIGSEWRSDLDCPSSVLSGTNIMFYINQSYAGNLGITNNSSANCISTATMMNSTDGYINMIGSSVPSTISVSNNCGSWAGTGAFTGQTASTATGAFYKTGASTSNTSGTSFSVSSSSISICQGTASINLTATTGAVTSSYGRKMYVLYYLDGATSYNVSTGRISSTTTVTSFNTSSLSLGAHTIIPVLTDRLIHVIGSPITITVTASGTWTGSVNTDWGNATNWSCGTLPTSSTDVIIPSGATNYPTVNISNAVAKSVTINFGATLNGGTGNLTLSGNFTNNGTFNPDTGTITVSNTGTTTFGGSTSPYTFYNLYLNKGATFSAQHTINNILNIKAGGYVTGSSPIYASGSTLKYNTGGDFVISTEWTDTAIPHHVTIGDEVNNSKLNFGAITSFRLANGNVTIGTGANTAKLTLSTAPGGDLKLKGNYTVAQKSSTTNNGRAVFFTGAAGNQIVTKSGGGTIDFDYLFVDKSLGDLQLSGTTGQKTNLQINSIGDTNVYQLELINGSIDLNGQMFTMNATNSTESTENTTNIKISGTGARRIYTSTGSGDFVFAGNYSAGKSNAKFNFDSSATLTFDTNVTLQTSVGLDFGTGSTLINSILQINQNGFVIGHSPYYGNDSTLIYNNGSNGFFRNMEWNSNSGAGYPNNVIVRGSNNTLVELDGESPIGFPVPNDLGCSGNLTVESGATLKFNNMNYDLYVAGNVNLSGSLQQSAMPGADLFVNGNWVQSGTGVLTGNNRTVVFNKQSSSIAQTISGSTTFDNITLNNSAGLNCIGATDNNTVNQNLTLTNGKITLNTNNLIIGASGNITNYSDTRYIVTNNTGELKRTLGTDKYYPVGSETAYNPIKLSNNGTTDVYGIRTIYGDITDAKNLSDPYDYFDSNAVLKLKWQITEAVSGGSILIPIPEWNFIDQGSNFSACSESVNLYNGDYTWLEADANYSSSFRKTATPSSALNPTDLSSGNHYITVGDVHDTTTYNGDANTGAWNKCLPNLKIKAVIKGTFDTSISQGTNFEAKKLTVDTTGNLTIKQDDFVRVLNEVVNNNLLTVENDGNLIQINNTNNSGSITVKRNAIMKRLDYTYWGSPVLGQNLRSFSSGTLYTRFYVYNESNDYFDGIFARNLYPDGTQSLTPLENSATYNYIPGKGYAVRAPNNYTTSVATFNGAFVGVPNNGEITFNLQHTKQGFNLVANPYPSNIDFDALYSANQTKIYQTAYFWTNVNPNPEMQGSQYPKTGSINNYAVYSGTGGLSAPYGFVSSGLNTTIGNTGNCPTCKVPNNIIKVGQGFIVKTKQLGSLAFNNTIRSNDGKGKFFNRITAPKKDRFWLELKTPLNFVNPILIGYVSGATDAFELDYDAPLMVEGADSFYSILGADKLAIQGKKYPMDLNDAIPLGATFYETGTHTISLVNKDGVFTTGQPIYLHDKLLNLYTDLQKQDYVFIADKGETKDRFEITYQPESTLSISNLEKEKVKIYYQEKDIVIEAYKTINEILIYDVSGKLIKSIKPKSKQLLIENSVLSNGVNVISIIFANEKINTKVISR